MQHHDTFKPEEQEEILRMAGIATGQGEFTTPAPVVDITEQVATSTDDRIEKVATEILAKARGNYDTAKVAADKWAQTEFDKVKLSKVQAAALGVDKAKHNKDEWQRIQREKEKVKSAMRKVARGHVATKIATTTSKKEQAAGNPGLDAFLLKHQGNPLIAELTELLDNN